MGIEGKEIQLEDKRLVTFRRVTSEDERFLLGVYESTRQDELALTNWDDAQRDAFVRMQFDAQQTHYRKYYPEGEHLIISVDDIPVGRLYVANLKEKSEILDITILPQHRSAGIGTPIIKELMAQAALLAKPLQIYVESFNRSLRLFERLGFVRSSQDGYNDLMVWKAL